MKQWHKLQAFIMEVILTVNKLLSFIIKIFNRLPEQTSFCEAQDELYSILYTICEYYSFEIKNIDKIYVAFSPICYVPNANYLHKYCIILFVNNFNQTIYNDFSKIIGKDFNFGFKYYIKPNVRFKRLGKIVACCDKSGNPVYFANYKDITNIIYKLEKLKAFK